VEGVWGNRDFPQQVSLRFTHRGSGALASRGKKRGFPRVPPG
jgi:hypothetical protein